MNFLLKLSLLFMIGSSLGWILELIYRRLQHKKWINPGFLAGPCLPLYGFGIAGLYLLCSVFDLSFIEIKAIRHIVMVIFITCFMTLLEYITGLIFIKGMKVKLWDYSDRRGNIQGIICPVFTLAWGIIGAIYYFFVHSLMTEMLMWFENNKEFLFFVGIYYGILAIDLCYSFDIANRIKNFAIEKHFIVKYESLKHSIAEKANSLKNNCFLFAFSSKNTLEAELRRYYCLHVNDNIVACRKRMDRLMAKRKKTEERAKRKTLRAKRKKLKIKTTADKTNADEIGL